MKIENKRLNENILNFNSSVKRRNKVAEYYFKHGIKNTMEHFNLTKQGVYSDVRAYKKFLSAYNLISNATTREEFSKITAKEIVPLFNNPRVGKYFDKDCKLEDLDFDNLPRIRRYVGGNKSYSQIKDFIKKHKDLIES